MQNAAYIDGIIIDNVLSLATYEDGAEFQWGAIMKYYYYANWPGTN